MANLFTSQTPANGNNFDASPLTLATVFTLSGSGNVTGGRFYAASSLSGGTYELVLWQATGPTTGTVLASATFGALTAGTWNSIVFSSPVAVSAGIAYVIGFRTSTGRYTTTASFFTSALVNGSITGIQDNTNPVGIGTLRNGVFATDITSFPSQTFNATCYFVDVDFTPSGATTVDLAADLTATGSMSATLRDEKLMSAAFVATGSMSEALLPERPLAAALTATGSMSAALTPERKLTAALTATGSMTAGFGSEVTLAANLTATAGMTAALKADIKMAVSMSATAAMSASLTIPTVGPVDPIATPVATALLACLTEQMNTLPSPPARIQLRAGAETGPLIGPNVDECCAGLAWVRVASVYPSWDSFPGPDNSWLPCGPLAYAVVLEMGSAFCMPWSDSDDTFDNIDPPNTDDWATSFSTMMIHQTLMRRAAACCFLPTQRRAVGEWAPLSVEGGCTGGTLRVTVSVMAPCGDC